MGKLSPFVSRVPDSTRVHSQAIRLQNERRTQGSEIVSMGIDAPTVLATLNGPVKASGRSWPEFQSDDFRAESRLAGVVAEE
jgi:hypothetical protein